MKNLTKKHWLIIGGAVAVVLAALIIVLAVSCNGNNDNDNDDNTGNDNTGDTNTGDNGNTNTEATYTLGMGIVVGIGHANNPADVQVDSTVAAVVLDANGVIVACRIDALQNIGTVSEGVITSTNTTSKADKGDAYGMANAIYYGGMDPNNDGVVKEWYEQAKAFEDYVTGKTVAQVEAMTTETNSIGYQWSTDATLLAAGCTIQIGEFRDAVVAACKDEQAATFTTSETFTVGVAAKGSLDTHDQQFKNATADADGVATLFSEYAATVLVNGVIVATLNDAVQPRLTFDMNGVEGTLSYTNTKRGLKADYGMANAIYYGGMDPNNDGVVKEWFEQSLAFSNYVTGKTVAQVEAMTTETNSIGYQWSTDATLLAAGCTIQISTIRDVVAASGKNAR